MANVSQTNVNFAHCPYCLPSGEAHGPQHPEAEPRLPSPTCSAAPGIPIVTCLADQFATLHSCAPPPGWYMLQGITICPPLIVESSPRPPESPALRRRSSRASPRSSRASSTDGLTCISPLSTTNPFQALADLAAPDLDDQEFPAETSHTFNSPPPGYTLVRKPLRTEEAAPLQLPKKGNALPRPRISQWVGTRKHPRGHHKTKGTPFCRSLAAAEPRIVQPQPVDPPTYPWRPFLADDLPDQPPSDQSVSGCDLTSLQSSSDSSTALKDTCSTPDIPCGKFWDCDSTSEPDALLHVLSGPYSTALSASTVIHDLEWLHPDPPDAEIE